MRRKLITMMAAFGAIILSIVGANISFFWIVNHAVEVDANHRVERWAMLLREDIPAFQSSLLSGSLSPAQEKALNKLLHDTDVFRLDIFNASGNQNISFTKGTVSPVPDFSAAIKPDIEKAIEGETVISLHEPSEGAAHADGYTVVTKALKSANGDIEAVGRFYVDQSGFVRTIKDSSRNLAIVLTILFTLVPAFFAFRMISSRAREEASLERLKFLARRDSLTGLYNRNGFNEKWQEKNLSCPNALLYVDIDHFKKVNDSFSHATGDALIKHVGNIIATSVGPDGFGARLGGDEFAVALYSENRHAAEELAATICERAAQPAMIQGIHITSSVSIGIHCCDGEVRSLEERMKMADFALYQSKTAGRSMYSNYSKELAAKAQRRKYLENALEQGLSDAYFFLVYQPKISAGTNTCIGFEALLRMRLPSGEVVSPVEFIPLMEDMGIAEKVGTWVLTEAARAAQKWPRDIAVSVNLSARQFNTGKLVDTVSKTIRETGLAPSRLILEVTESQLIEAPEAAERELTQLRKLGVSISIDDFGTGYSSLGYLWRFGFDKIKIDRSFVIGLMENRARTLNILDSIIVMSHRLGMSIIVEGVETEEQVHILREMGVDCFQGYYFSKPMPEEEVPAYIATQKTQEWPETTAS